MISNFSMDSVLQSREADPEEVLYNLGFADSEALAKIPRRFFQKPSVARGVSIENFKRQQEEMFGRYESGFFGYRGLQGNFPQTKYFNFKVRLEAGYIGDPPSLWIKY